MLRLILGKHNFSANYINTGLCYSSFYSVLKSLFEYAEVNNVCDYV